MSKSTHAPGAGIGAPARYANHATQVIDGERKASDYLARLHTQQADPDELALIVSMMYGAMLRGFCAAITKALGSVHHG